MRSKEEVQKLTGIGGELGMAYNISNISEVSEVSVITARTSGDDPAMKLKEMTSSYGSLRDASSTPGTPLSGSGSHISGGNVIAETEISDDQPLPFRAGLSHAIVTLWKRKHKQAKGGYVYELSCTFKVRGEQIQFNAKMSRHMPNYYANSETHTITYAMPFVRDFMSQSSFYLGKFFLWTKTSGMEPIEDFTTAAMTYNSGINAWVVRVVFHDWIEDFVLSNSNINDRQKEKGVVGIAEWRAPSKKKMSWSDKQRLKQSKPTNLP